MFDKNEYASNPQRYIAEQLHDIAEALRDINHNLYDGARQLEDTQPMPAVEHASAHAAALQERANYNRDNAAQLYADKLYYEPAEKRWRTREGKHLVVFTPYGWIPE